MILYSRMEVELCSSRLAKGFRLAAEVSLAGGEDAMIGGWLGLVCGEECKPVEVRGECGCPPSSNG